MPTRAGRKSQHRWASPAPSPEFFHAKKYRGRRLCFLFQFAETCRRAPSQAPLCFGCQRLEAVKGSELGPLALRAWIPPPS